MEETQLRERGVRKASLPKPVLWGGLFLLVSIPVLPVLAIVGMPVVAWAKAWAERGRTATIEEDLKALNRAIEIFEDVNGRPPLSFEELKSVRGAGGREKEIEQLLRSVTWSNGYLFEVDSAGRAHARFLPPNEQEGSEGVASSQDHQDPVEGGE
jgi:hypothetical protein